ncbi:MAG: IS66 family transposase [Gammaproteobacteria bacterium]|nr:IS66 family transposase [Gammaproteobacteria bacterium]
MKLNNVNVNGAIKEVEFLLAKEKNMSPALKAAIKILIMLVTILANSLGVTSKNSSKPPSDDKNRKRGSMNKKSDKKPGGQKGHVGTKLKKIADPDEIEELEIDRRTLPKGEYKRAGYESRQIFDINVSRTVTEYRAEILEDQHGKRYVAKFPEYVRAEVQYGAKVKTQAVYMSQFQLIPYKRIQDYFADQVGLPLSVGSIFNFNKEAYNLLEGFAQIAKEQLCLSDLINADETGINVNKKRLWLHSASNHNWTYFYPHEKRGTEAMDQIGILPNFSGVLCHDHWKPYYKYECAHALCNAHHIRELTWAEEQDNQQWSKLMRELLEKINKAVHDAGGTLDRIRVEDYRKRYRKILENGEPECPAPKRKEGQKGRLKKSKSRNLLERLQNYENDTLRFMENDFVPFTNNLGENDLRMTKVQQKISGCFGSMDGAYIFCLVRSYLSTCRKNGVGATEALRLLFQGKMPGFINDLMLGAE